MPTFAVGRSQEVMIVLEEAIRRGQIDNVPVYLDGMIWEATAIHTTYPEYLNVELQDMIFHKGQNPFLSPSFIQVDSQQKRQAILADPSPCIVLATSGMMNGGPIMEYFKTYGADKRNTLIFVGYQAEGSLGRRIQKGWGEIPMTIDGKTEVMKVQMEVTTVDGFSGHSDRRQLMEYVKRMEPRPERIITNHGDENKCLDLASSIYKKFKYETKVADEFGDHSSYIKMNEGSGLHFFYFLFCSPLLIMRLTYALRFQTRRHEIPFLDLRTLKQKSHYDTRLNHETEAHQANKPQSTVKDTNERLSHEVPQLRQKAYAIQRPLFASIRISSNFFCDARIIAVL